MHAAQVRDAGEDFSYMAAFYESVLALPGSGVRAVVLHDGLPESLTRRSGLPPPPVYRR